MYGVNSKTRFYVNVNQAWGAWVSILFLLSWLDKTIIPIPYIGDAAVILLAISLGEYAILRIVKHNRAYTSIVTIMVLFAFLIGIYGIGEIFNPVSGVKSILQLFLLALYFLGAVYILPRDDTIKVIANLWVLSSLFNMMIWMVNGFVYPLHGIFAQKNLLGGTVAFGTYFILVARSLSSSRAWWNFGIIVSLIVLIASGSRTAWLATITIIVIYIFWPQITTRKWIFSLIFALMFIGSLSLIYIYVELSNSPQFHQMAALVWRYTKQNLYSGRQVFWPVLIDAIQQRPWGYGPGTTPEFFISTSLSSHNLYLQVTLQTGYIGLFSLAAILWSIWNYLFRLRQDSLVRLTGAFLLGSLVYESFEVSLIQNNLTIGIVVWSIFAVGVGRFLQINSRSFRI